MKPQQGRPTPLRGARKTARGLGLLECLIGIVIFALTIMSVIFIIPASYKAAEQDSIYLQATALAQAYMDTLRQSVMINGNVPLPAPPNPAIDFGDKYTDGGTAMTTPGNFTVTSNLCPLVAGSSVRYDCVVNVQWSFQGMARSYSIETYVTAQ